MNNGVDVNAKGEGRWTPLFNAVYWAIDQLPTGHKEIVELLITKGAYVNAKIEVGKLKGQTPLDLAVTYKQTADLLRKHGGKTGKELKAEGK